MVLLEVKATDYITASNIDIIVMTLKKNIEVILENIYGVKCQSSIKSTIKRYLWK